MSEIKASGGSQPESRLSVKKGLRREDKNPADTESHHFRRKCIL